MPGMDGLDILDYVNQNERHEKVIIITAFGELETAIRAMTGGAFDYITKPFKKEQILHTLDRAMNWQILESEAMACQEMCLAEPYATAEAEFRRRYVLKMATRYEHDIDEICAKSGLSRDEIVAIVGN
jgi:FixJ family two-component response regulator